MQQDVVHKRHMLAASAVALVQMPLQRSLGPGLPSWAKLLPVLHRCAGPEHGVASRRCLEATDAEVGSFQN